MWASQSKTGKFLRIRCLPFSIAVHPRSAQIEAYVPKWRLIASGQFVFEQHTASGTDVAAVNHLVVELRFGVAIEKVVQFGQTAVDARGSQFVIAAAFAQIMPAIGAYDIGA